MATVSEGRVAPAVPLAWRRGLIGELWAEFFGCFILISFGDGVVEVSEFGGRADLLAPAPICSE